MRTRTASFLLIMLIAVGALSRLSATPIKPDLKKLLSEPPKTQQYPPARAGWNGPEGSSSQQAALSPALERYGPAASARAIRQSIWSLFIPDWRTLLGLFSVIFLLRYLKSRSQMAEPDVLIPVTANAAPAEPETRAA